MSWLDTTIDRLAQARQWSYHAGGPPATEPTALAALALLGHDRPAAAQRALDWLTRTQEPSGTVGVTAREKSPGWPTALAILAWQAWDVASGSSRYHGPIQRAVRWALQARGETLPRSPNVGHDTTLAGWPWVLGTHSWLEPTAYFVLALKATGHTAHPRTREAVRLLADRLLPSGGCNYGNTLFMGQELLPHVQPTGLVLVALAGERLEDARVERSLEYLEAAVETTAARASLAFGLLGLTAHGRRPAASPVWLERVHNGGGGYGPRSYTDALVALAALPSLPPPFARTE